MVAKLMGTALATKHYDFVYIWSTDSWQSLHVCVYTIQEIEYNYVQQVVTWLGNVVAHLLFTCVSRKIYGAGTYDNLVVNYNKKY